MLNPETVPSTFSEAIKEKLEKGGLSKYAFGKEMAKLGHTMSWTQLGYLIEGNLPSRRWDSTILSVASILGVTPFKLLGLPIPNQMYDKVDLAWPGPLVYEAKGHSHSWIARELGVSQVRVGNWFSGNLPPLAMLWRLADVLKCEVSELLPTKKQVKDVLRGSVK